MILTHTHPDGTVHAHDLAGDHVAHGHLGIPKPTVAEILERQDELCQVFENAAASPDHISTVIDDVLKRISEWRVAGHLNGYEPDDLHSDYDYDTLVNVTADGICWAVALKKKEEQNAPASP